MACFIAFAILWAEAKESMEMNGVLYARWAL